MEGIKRIIDDIGIEAFENRMNIAGLAVISNSGQLIHQTDKWDLSDQASTILEGTKGDSSLMLSGTKFSVVEITPEVTIASNDSGMGYVIITSFQGGVLAPYAIPQADIQKMLTFLNKNSAKFAKGEKMEVYSIER